MKLPQFLEHLIAEVRLILMTADQHPDFDDEATPESIHLAVGAHISYARERVFITYLSTAGGLLFFPAFEGFFVEVAAFEVAGDDAVTGAEEVGEEEEKAEDENDGGAGGDVCPEGNEQAYDGAECSECGASPEHDIE